MAGLLLAAGGGRRYGMPKALVRHGQRLLVEHGVATLREGGCSPVVVILGAAAAEVRRTADLGDAWVVDNAAWEEGMGSSLRLGLATLARTDALAVVVLLVDTPKVTAQAVARLAALASPDVLATATYHGRRGHPVLLGRHHWDGVAASAVGDRGARAYLGARHVVTVACEDVGDGVTDWDHPPGDRDRSPGVRFRQGP